MIHAPIPINDKERVQELHDMDILDTLEDDNFTDIVQLASKICQTPISLISLVDSSRQWFKAKIGVTDTETPRNISFCGHAILHDNDFFEVPDALKDIRFFDNPLVISDPNIRFYAGVQLTTKKGYNIGMLCVNDTKPNKLTPGQIFALKVLGNHVAKMLDLRITKKQSEEKSKKIESQNEILRKMLSIIAHDVRGPIGSLLNIFEMSEAKMIDEASKNELLKMSKAQVESILHLLNNLVGWGVANIENKVTNKVKSPLKDLVDQEISLLQLSATLKENTLSNLVNKDVVLPVENDMMQFIVRNLLTNANKFTSKGKIVVYSDKTEDHYTLTFNDTGKGMDEETIQTLLENNKIITTPGTHNEKGSGLGFKLIKEFVENVGGSINIVSELGKGTSISLNFPLN